MNEFTCRNCKRPLSDTRFCSFCKTNLSTIPSAKDNERDAATALPSDDHDVVDACALPPRSQPLADVLVSPRSRHDHATAAKPRGSRQTVLDSKSTSFAEMKNLLTPLVFKLNALESKMSTIDRKVNSSQLDTIRTLDHILREFQNMIVYKSNVQSWMDRMSSAVNTLKEQYHSLTVKSSVPSDGPRSTLEAAIHSERGSRAPAASALGFEEMEMRLKKLELDQRERELIVYGLPNIESEIRSNTLSLLASVLKVPAFSPEDIDSSARINGNNPYSRPLIVRFTTAAKRNEWLARARDRRDLATIDVLPFWPLNNIDICEDSAASETGANDAARRLAKDLGIERFLTHRGTVFFKRTEWIAIYRYFMPEYLTQTDSTVNNPILSAYDLVRPIRGILLRDPDRHVCRVAPLPHRLILLV